MKQSILNFFCGANFIWAHFLRAFRIWARDFLPFKIVGSPSLRPLEPLHAPGCNNTYIFNPSRSWPALIIGDPFFLRHCTLYWPGHPDNPLIFLSFWLATLGGRGGGYIRVRMKNMSVQLCVFLEAKSASSSFQWRGYVLLLNQKEWCLKSPGAL